MVGQKGKISISSSASLSLMLVLALAIPLSLSAQSRFKRIQYDYDLISGNVKEVHYQAGEADQMHHRYSYDADNRITNVETSRNQIDYREDAQYFYYPHGPLQRVELGQNKVQGLDYAYTLQGWLKGINGNELTPELDMGQDALPGDVNANIGRDVFGTSLGYYGDNDYTAIDPAKNTAAARPFAPIGAGGTLHDEQKPLYNGNIAHTVNTLAPFTGYPDAPAAPGQVLAMVYRYDQLNRLKAARGYAGLTTTNKWEDATGTTPQLFDSYYSYDANGNIDSVGRHDQDGELYDTLRYGYQLIDLDPGAGVLHRNLRNRLYHLTETADDNAVTLGADGVEDLPETVGVLQDPYGTTVGDQNINGTNSTNNYRYDELGNLIRDTREHIDHITWTVAGKVKAVDQAAGSGKKDAVFHYGADGQRISKEVYDDAGSNLLYRDHYVRDAQGNIMAVYRYDQATASLKVTERPLYGSSRLGTDAYELELAAAPPYDPTADPPGQLRYELADHLGNVTSVLTDELLPVDVNNDDVPEYFQPHVVSASGYEPFGSLLPGRNYSSGTPYRHMFQGQEHDDEMYGSVGTSYAFEYRIHDPRIGRFLSVDPLAVQYPFNSPYAFSENDVIRAVELEGLEKEIVVGGKQENMTLGGGTSESCYQETLTRDDPDNAYDRRSFKDSDGKAAMWGGLESSKYRSIGWLQGDLQSFLGNSHLPLDGTMSIRQDYGVFDDRNAWLESPSISYSYTDRSGASQNLYWPSGEALAGSARAAEERTAMFVAKADFVTSQVVSTTLALLPGIGLASSAESSTASRSSTFGERMFLSGRFGISSTRFANSAVGLQGTWNRAGSMFKMGWTSTGKYGGGYLFRVGIGRSSGNANQALLHFQPRFTFVGNGFGNGTISLRRSLGRMDGLVR